MNKLKSLFSIILISVLPFFSYSQSECSKKLKAAEKIYDQGNLGQVKELLDACLEKGFTKQEKTKAYKLLCMDYLYDDDTENAEEAMLSLLHEDPEYYVDRDIEKIEFLKLYEKFRTSPSYSMFVGFGVNQTLVSPAEPFGVQNLETTSSSYDRSGVGLLFQLGFNKYIKPNFIIGTEVNYKTSSYINVLDLGFTKVTFKENFSTLDIPLFIKYEFGKGKWRPFIKAGGGVNLLLGSEAEVAREYGEGSVRPQADETGPEISLKEQRNFLNYYVFGSLGVKYKLPMSFLYLDVRFNSGLTNSVNGDNRYTNKDLAYRYYYIDDDFFINNAIISFGYEKLFYNPKKKRTKKK